jgi:hypothetical protein
MLRPPSKGFARSVNTHNVDVDALTDWIEGCVTFDEKRVSIVALADLLVEELIYDDQDFAKERITDAWAELRRRKRCLGSACPFNVAATRVERVKSWRKTPAYAFCLMLSLQVPYRKEFIDLFGADYTEQGALFERLTQEALSKLGWKTHSTGWSKGAASSIVDKVEALARHLGERSRPDAVNLWTEDNAKDGGLDVVCHLAFSDQWAGRPLFYVQCASGENWKEKRHTPVLDLWDKLLDLATRPRRGISIPFALLADDFRRAANFDLLALFLDRHRLSGPPPVGRKGWLSPALARDLNKWTASRLPAIQNVRAT